MTEHAVYGSLWSEEEGTPCVFHLCAAIEVSLRRKAWKQHTVPGRGVSEGERERGRGHKRCSVFSGKREKDEEGGCLSRGVEV